jgi:hypothetical protein
MIESFQAEAAAASQWRRSSTIARQINTVLARYGRGFNKADNDREGGAIKIYTGLRLARCVRQLYVDDRALE